MKMIYSAKCQHIINQGIIEPVAPKHKFNKERREESGFSRGHKHIPQNQFVRIVTIDEGDLHVFIVLIMKETRTS